MSSRALRSRPVRHWSLGAEDPGTVRVAAMAGVPAVLREKGFDPAPVLAEVGLAPGIFDDPDLHMSYRTAGLLLQRCAELTGCQHFGLLAGQHASASSLGLLVELIQSSPTVQSALDSLIAHVHLKTRGGVPTLLLTDGLDPMLYGQPEDDWKDVDPDKVARVARLVFRSVHSLASDLRPTTAAALARPGRSPAP